MDKVIASINFKGSFHEFTEFLRTDPQFYYDKPEDLVNGVPDYREKDRSGAGALVREAAAVAVWRDARFRISKRRRRRRPTTKAERPAWDGRATTL